MTKEQEYSLRYLKFINSLTKQLKTSNPNSNIFIHSNKNSSILINLIQSILATNRSLEASTSHSDLSCQDFISTRTPNKQDLLNKIALVDLDQDYTTRILFDTILNQLSNWTTSNGENLVWNTLENKVENWDKRQEGLEVVNERISSRKRKGEFDLNVRSNRVRQDVEIELDNEVMEEPIDGSEEAEEVGVEDLRKWSLEWSRISAPSIQEVSFIKDTLDHFYDGLHAIYKLETDSNAIPTASSTSNKDGKERRWIVFDHGERINDVASAGALGGAPKETGLGMTFAASIYRLGELVRNRRVKPTL